MRVPLGDRLRAWGDGRRTGAAPLDWPALLERGLLILLALLVARLAWAIVTPVGSLGAWQGRQPQLLSAPARQALFASFDPFFRTGAPQPAGGVVTSLALTVYGIRLNEGSGLGSAIIAGPDGVQNSFAVGDEILPGVVLKAVAFDHVTIDRGGAAEQVFLDQSTPAPEPAASASTSGWQSAAPPPPSGAGPTVDQLKSDIGFVPRLDSGRVTGLVVQSRGPAFAAVGLRPGDIISQVNGQPVGDLQSLQSRIAPGARLSLTVERGATTATVNIIVQDR